MDSKLSQRFRRRGERERWLPPREKFLLAVSGGGDSMAMLKLFYDLCGPGCLAVAHLDHGLREASAEDCRFVQEVCRNLQVPCHVDRQPVLELRQRGEGLEEAARRVRHRFLEEIRHKIGARWIALAHSRDDLAETLLMNLGRGCGIWGLAAMAHRRDPILRPVLDFSRQELRQILKRSGWTWIDDETNDSRQFLRNRVRLDLLPLMAQEINPQIADHLAALAAEAAQWRDEEERLACQDRQRLEVPVPWPWLAFDLAGLRQLSGPGRIRLLRSCARSLGLGFIDRRRLDQLESLILRSGRWLFQWGSTVDLLARGGLVLLGPASEKLSPQLTIRPGSSLRWGGWEATLQEASRGQASPWSLWGPLVEEVRLVQRQGSGGCWLADSLPRVLWGEIFSADPKITGWENRGYSVKCESPLRLDLKPLSGHWRVDHGI